MLVRRLPGVHLKLFCLSGKRQLAITEPNRLNAAQRVGTVITVITVVIGNRSGRCIIPILRHLAGIPGYVDTIATLQRVITGTTFKDIVPVRARDHVGAVITRPAYRIRAT